MEKNNPELIFAFAEYYAEHPGDVRKAFDDFLPSYRERTEKNINKVAKMVFTAIFLKTGVKKIEILSKDRHHRIVEAKQIFAYVMKKKGFTPTEIANYMNHDRVTVMFRIMTAENLLAVDKNFREKVSDIMEKL